MLVTIVIVLLVLALVGGLPSVGVAPAGFGYGPSGLIGLVVVVLIVLLLLGRL